MKQPPDDSDEKLRVLDLTPREDQANKPAELIQINGHESLTLNSRRSITILWHHAHQQGVEEGKDYTIEIAELVAARHNGYEMVEEAVVQLMTTLLTVKHPDGSTSRTQFLGGNNMDSPKRPAGVLTYSFDKRLVAVLKDSTIWGKIDLPVLKALSSKFAVSLYESLAQLAGLEHKTAQTMSLEEFRKVLGVEDGKYEIFGDLNKYVLKPVVAEINALAPFNVMLMPIKTGRKVTHIYMNWWAKTLDERKEAWAEMQRPRIGRRERISGQVDRVLDPTPNPQALLRQTKRKLPQSSPPEEPTSLP